MTSSSADGLNRFGVAINGADSACGALYGFSSITRHVKTLRLYCQADRMSVKWHRVKRGDEP